jgi:hypothetical protein
VNEVGDGHEDQALFVGERGGITLPHHGAIVIHELGDYCYRLNASQAAKIHGGLGVAGPMQNSTGNGPQWQDVARANKVLRLGVRAGQNLQRTVSVCG